MRTGGTSLLSSPQWLYICVSAGYIRYDFFPLSKEKIISLPRGISLPAKKTDNCINSFRRLPFLLAIPLVEIIVFFFLCKDSYPFLSLFFRDQALDLLVSVSCTHCCASTSDLSTLLSSRGLTTLRYGISYLEVSFTLRCFQRLSHPHFATLPCRWRDNRCTIGAFIPVLSY